MLGEAAGWRRRGMIRLPPFGPGLRIGLYGGTFDPPHPGHRHVATAALKRLGLDRIWWMVTPGNPLKSHAGLAPVLDRQEATRRLAAHPRMTVTEFEAALGSTYTIETVRYLRRRCPGVHFVFVMGADSWAGFHRWRGWRDLARLVPIAVVDRPGWTLRASAARAALTLARDRVPEAQSRCLPGLNPPAWLFLHGRRSGLSSTSLRANAAERRRGR